MSVRGEEGKRYVHRRERGRNLRWIYLYLLITLFSYFFGFVSEIIDGSILTYTLMHLSIRNGSTQTQLHSYIHVHIGTFKRAKRHAHTNTKTHSHTYTNPWICTWHMHMAHTFFLFVFIGLRRRDWAHAYFRVLFKMGCIN